MAKRMKFSVVGLPHYTIWHLYEPSVEDIRHMEEMDKERKAKEAEEKAKKEHEEKIKNSFDAKSGDWEKEKAAVQDMVQKAKNDAKQGEAQPQQPQQPKPEQKIQEASGEDEKPRAQPAQ